MGFGKKLLYGCTAAATVAGAAYVAARLIVRRSGEEDPQLSAEEADRAAARVSWPVYEWLWGKGWVSPGGQELTIELVEIVFQETQFKVPARAQMRVLDVHTGTGGFAFHMVDRYGANVIGIDEKEHAVRRLLPACSDMPVAGLIDQHGAEPGAAGLHRRNTELL